METPRVRRSPWSPLGCAIDIQRDVISFGSAIWHEYGDYVKDRLLPTTDCLFLFHPDALEHVLQKEYKRYSRGGFIYQGLKVLVGKGLTTSNGELWLRQRRLIQPFFHRAKVDNFVPVIIDEVKKFLDGVQSREDRIVDMVSEMDKLFLSISLRTLFSGTDLDASTFAQVLRSIGPDITSYIRLPFPPLVVPTPLNRRLKQKINRLDDLIERVIEERKANPLSGEPDILQSLIEHNDPRQVRDELMTLIIAGYQTTSLSLSFAWSLLAQHPDVARKLREEIDMVGDRDITEEDLSRLVYARGVFMETLRLYPPSFGMLRQADEDDTICGHDVSAGTLIFMSPYFTHRHPAFWDRPEDFDPKRFMPGGTKPHHKFAYVPFGGGPHFCAGNHLALIEGLIALVMIARRYNLRFADDAFRPQVQALALTTMKELPMVFEAR